MSRSYRKPFWTQGYGGAWRNFAKRQSSKRVRRTKSVSNGNYYKRISNSWDICDYKFYDAKSEQSWKVKCK